LSARLHGRVETAGRLDGDGRRTTEDRAAFGYTFTRRRNDGKGLAAMILTQRQRLPDAHAKSCELAVPLTDKAALTILGISHGGFVLLIQAQNIRWTGFNAHPAACASETININVGHAVFPFDGRPGGHAASGGPV
jgi:hypothetical protein